MSARISLSPEQFARAEQEAIRRQTENEAKGLRGRNKAPAKGAKALEMHRLGCVGEMAVAAYVGMEQYVFTEASPVRNSEDLPGSLEVKTRSRHGYDLLIQIDGDPNKTYVLATYEGSEIELVGWIHGKDAMRKEWIKEYVRGRPCYAVKQSRLNSIETLHEQLNVKLPRVLSSHEAWLSGGDEEEDDLFLHFAPELTERLGWSVGDTLEWDVDPNTNCCIIRKLTNECSQDKSNGVCAGMDRDGSPKKENQSVS